MGRRHHPIRYGVEKTWMRRLLNRKLRRQTARAFARGDEALPRPRGTQGWHTW